MPPNTEDLIRQLSRDLPPAPALHHPFLRAATWTAGAAVYVAFVVMWMAPPDVVTSRWSDLSFTLQQIAALATAATAAAAAFSSTVPGRGRGALIAAIIAASAWLGLVVSGCIQDWMAAGRAGLALRSDWACVVGIPLTAVVPGLGLAVMLRRGAPLHARTATALGALGVASLASLGMCFAQPHERDIIVLVWHGATMAAVSVAAAMAGRAILDWRHLIHASVATVALLI